MSDEDNEAKIPSWLIAAIIIGLIAVAVWTSR